MVEFVTKRNPRAENIEEIAKSFIKVGKKYGLRGDIAFCQSIIETGWFRFDGGTAVKPKQHNYCGLGVVSKGISGHSFDTVEDGVTAQIQHLYAYASKEDIPKGEKMIDPRFHYVTRGIAEHWEDLNMRWAMNNTYGQQIMSIYEDMLEYQPPKNPDVVESNKPYREFVDYLADRLKDVFGK